MYASPSPVRASPSRLDLISYISAGLNADGRVLIDKARVECQSHRLTVEDPVTVEYITRHIAGIQQVRPLVRNSVIAQTDWPVHRNTRSQEVYGHSECPRLSLASTRMTPGPVSTRLNPEASTVHGRCSGMASLRINALTELATKANAIGRSSKTVREFLEKNHKDDLSRDDTVKLTIKSLLEVVQTGAKNIEINVMESYGKITVGVLCNSYRTVILKLMSLQALEQTEIEAIVQEIEREKEAGGFPAWILLAKYSPDDIV